MIRNFLKDNYLVADGAMGTYFSDKTGLSSARAEMANIQEPKTIVSIHKEYIQSGARLIRTNTFSANTVSLNINRETLKEIISAAWDSAMKASENQDIFIAANMGPLPRVGSDGDEIPGEQILDEYRFLIDSFIEKGAYIFNFETFSSLEFLEETFAYIRSRNPEAFICLQFAVDKSGYTRQGLSLKELIRDAFNLKADVTGLNCGTGPVHLSGNIKEFSPREFWVSVYPNAGYPEQIHNRTVYNNNPRYFAGIMEGLKSAGVKILGGCCGTTPDHIRSLTDLLSGKNQRAEERQTPVSREKKPQAPKGSSRDLLIAVELDPPFKPNLNKILKGAKEMKEMGVDMITIADSPSGRMRLNPIITASRIKREVNIDVMPHICCRDRNLIALKSDILAAHTEGIDKLLIVTGDPIPQEERDEVKKVFNCNSLTLIQQVQTLNTSLLCEDPFLIAGALNLNSKNRDSQARKMRKKAEAGAVLFLTQPLYEDEAVSYLLNMEKAPGTRILAGILPLVTYNNALFLNNEFPGISIPDHIINRFSPDMEKNEALQTGIEIAVETVNSLKESVDGFYFMTPFNRTSMIKEILLRSGLK